MKKLILMVALFVVALPIQAEVCKFTWKASVSKNIKHYNLYMGNNLVTDGITKLVYSMPCIEGTFALTAVNKAGLESVKSKTVSWAYKAKPSVKRPKSPTQFQLNAK